MSDKLRFVADALYHMACMDVALEGSALRGLHAILEDCSNDLAIAERKRNAPVRISVFTPFSWWRK